MIQLSNTKYGSKRRAIIGGFAYWDDLNKSATILFYVQILNNNDVLLDDLSVYQNREVVYTLNNTNLVNAQFDTVQSGGVGEYDYFWNMVLNPPKKANGDSWTFVDIILQLAEKLKTRGLFD